jgi:hypothetical protein
MTLQWCLACASGFETMNISKPQSALKEKSRELTGGKRGARIYAKISCNIPASLLFLSRVNRLKSFVALIVLTLWASCTIRCELVNLACSDAVACCDGAVDKSPEKPAPADHCVCSWVRFGGYIAEKSAISLPQPVDFSPFTLSAPVEVPLPNSLSLELIFPVPELLTSWHISNRAAAPPRAPTFAS